MTVISVNQPHEATRLNVIGVPGEGKSVYRAVFLRRIYRCGLWNPMTDYHIGDVITVDEFRERLDSYRRGAMRWTVRPTTWDEIGMTEEYNALCAYVYECGALHFATEEPALVADASAHERIPSNMRRLAIEGRHRAVSLSYYGQRFHQFHTIIRGTASEIVAFRQTDPEDVRDFDRRISPSVSPVPLNELPEHHYIHYTRESGAVFCAPLEYNEPFEKYQPPKADPFDVDTERIVHGSGSLDDYIDAA